MDIAMIVAMDAAHGVAKDGKLPWSNKEDMRHFACKTKGEGKNAVVMGHATWQSLPHPPLANRVNLVLSKTMQEEEGCTVVRSPEEALLVAHALDLDELWVIGGPATYKAFENLGVLTRLVVTLFDDEYECDLFYSPGVEGYMVESWERIEGGTVTTWMRA